MSPQRSQRKKNIIEDSDNDDFVAVASDNGYSLDEEDMDDDQMESHSNRAKLATSRFDRRRCRSRSRGNFIGDTTFAGKKRALATYESDEDDVFIPSPTRDSPKKPRAKEPSTPSKSSAHQHLFDAAVSKARAKVATPLQSLKGDNVKPPASGSSKSPSKVLPPAMELNDSTVYMEDVEMCRVVVPELHKCEIYQPGLIDSQLKPTYKKIPRLPRMADYAPVWGQSCSDGGFQFSEVLKYYPTLDVAYFKRLVAFSHDKAGNIANLSRVDPALLGVKDANSFSKNVLYLYGNSS